MPENTSVLVVLVLAVAVVLALVCFRCGCIETKQHDEKTELSIPLVNSDGKGEMGTVSITLSEGIGRLLADTSKTRIAADTQESLINSYSYVTSMVQTSNVVDVVYSFETPSSSVEGRSAGAGFGVVLVSALQGITVNNSVTITGELASDGSILGVADTEKKIMAAKKAGFQKILIPSRSSGVGAGYVKKLSCDENGCEMTYMPDTHALSRMYGIEVVAVSDFSEVDGHLWGGL